VNININKNDNLFTKGNHNLDKIMDLKMKIKQDLIVQDYVKVKNIANIKIENQEVIEGSDIPSKISSLLKELKQPFESDAKGKKATSGKKLNKNDNPNNVNSNNQTKNFTEYKYDIIMKNNLNNDENKHVSDEILQSQCKLLHMIKNPNTLICDKTKHCMDRLLNNGLVEKNQFQR